MDATEMRGYVAAFDGVNAVDNAGDTFFLYDPGRDLPPERQMPFVTLVTGDRYDHVSDLDRPDVYRLNIGLTTATYTGRYGSPPTGERDPDGVLLDLAYDFAALDTLMPHPVYASHHWVCVLNPGPATLPTVLSYLDEAYEFARRKYTNAQARRRS